MFCSMDICHCFTCTRYEYSEKPGWGILLFAFVVVVCLLFRTGVLWVALDQVGLTHKVSWFLPPECLD